MRSPQAWGKWPHRQASSLSELILSCTFISNHRFL